MKQSIQLNLDAEIIRKLRERKVNISELVNNILKQVIQQESLAAEEITLSLLIAERQQLEERLKRVEEAAARFRALVSQQDARIQQQQAIIAELRKSERIAALMRELNDIIVRLNFRLEDVQREAANVLQKLSAEGIPASTEWLQRHIQRIEVLGK